MVKEEKGKHITASEHIEMNFEIVEKRNHIYLNC
jgi:hypothetical protein